MNNPTDPKNPKPLANVLQLFPPEAKLLERVEQDNGDILEVFGSPRPPSVDGLLADEVQEGIEQWFTSRGGDDVQTEKKGPAVIAVTSRVHKATVRVYFSLSSARWTIAVAYPTDDIRTKNFAARVFTALKWVQGQAR